MGFPFTFTSKNMILMPKIFENLNRKKITSWPDILSKYNLMPELGKWLEYWSNIGYLVKLFIQDAFISWELEATTLHNPT